MNPIVEHHRAFLRRLRNRSFVFCDDNVPRLTGEYLAFRDTYQKTTSNLDSLIAEGIDASSTDARDQGIENTLQDDGTFWSSTGTDGVERLDVEESLTYRLKDPLCVVHSIQIFVYRAVYQRGNPIYPPISVTVHIGTSPTNLMECTLKPCKIHPDEEAQPIKLPYRTQPIGNYLQIRLHGKQQAQFQDNAFYIAIRRVEALGLRLPIEHCHDIRAAMLSSALFYRHPFSARDIPDNCRYPNGRTVIEEMCKRIEGKDQGASKKAPSLESSETRFWPISWESAAERKPLYRVYDFHECM